MTADVKGERAYSSPIREARARQTRSRITEAAGELFGRRGYVATTIGAIAEESGVAVQTVYAAFGNKRAILWSLLETAVAGDAEPRTLLERVRDELNDCDDPRERLRRVTSFGRRAMERSAGVHRVMREAAAADPEVRSALEEVEARRYKDARSFVELAVGERGLAEGVGPQEAADLFYAFAGYGLYDDLVVGRGWSGERYERWVTAALEAVLLPS